MGIFIHEGRGYYIGSTVIVKANNIEEAKNMIRSVLDEHGLVNEEVDVVDISNKKVLYVHNGDY